MKIIAGLGNPGRQYKDTPHNIGFSVIDVLAGRNMCRMRRSLRFSGHTGDVTLRGERALLLKPQTYMNLSGQSVGAVLRYRKLTVEDLVVVVDDADLDLGRIRIRSRGGTGGHRGLNSIIEHTGSREFVRVRVGIGRGGDQQELVSHVLAPFNAAQKKVAQAATDRAADAIEAIIADGVEAAMNAFNGVPGE